MPGVDINMGNELLRMSNGKVLRYDHIALSVPQKFIENWRQTNIGDTVRFKAKIPLKSGLFPKISLSEFDGDPEVVLMLGLVNCELIGIVHSA